MKRMLVLVWMIALILGLSALSCAKEAEAPAAKPAPKKAAPEKAPAAGEPEAEGEAGDEAVGEEAPEAEGEAEGETEPEAKKEEPKKDVKEVAVLKTGKGKIYIEFFPEKAPKHVENFKKLCKTGFYNGTMFHRVVPGFVIQGGDPNTKDPNNRAMWGAGGQIGPDGKEINVEAEFNDESHKRGIVSMARAQDPNSASSQFFICVADRTDLDGKYTVFGKVIKGMDIVDKIVMVRAQREMALDPVGLIEAKIIPEDQVE